MKKLVLILVLVSVIPASAQQFTIGFKDILSYDYFAVNQNGATSLNFQDTFGVQKNHQIKEVVVAYDVASFTYTLPYDFKGAGIIPDTAFTWGSTKFENLKDKPLYLTGSFSKYRVELEVPLERGLGYTRNVVLRPIFLCDVYNLNITFKNIDKDKETVASQGWTKSNLGVGVMCDYPFAQQIRAKGKFAYMFLNGSNATFFEFKLSGAVYGGIGAEIGYSYYSRYMNFDSGDGRFVTQGPLIGIMAVF